MTLEEAIEKARALYNHKEQIESYEEADTILAVLCAAERWAAIEWAGRDRVLNTYLWDAIEDTSLDYQTERILSAYRKAREDK